MFAFTAPVDSSSQSWQGIKRFYDTVSVRGLTSSGEFVEGGDAEAWQVRSGRAALSRSVFLTEGCVCRFWFKAEHSEQMG